MGSERRPERAEDFEHLLGIGSRIDRNLDLAERGGGQVPHRLPEHRQMWNPQTASLGGNQRQAEIADLRHFTHQRADREPLAGPVAPTQDGNHTDHDRRHQRNQGQADAPQQKQSDPCEQLVLLGADQRTEKQQRCHDDPRPDQRRQRGRQIAR